MSSSFGSLSLSCAGMFSQSLSGLGLNSLGGDGALAFLAGSGLCSPVGRCSSGVRNGFGGAWFGASSEACLLVATGSCTGTPICGGQAGAFGLARLVRSTPISSEAPPAIRHVHTLVSLVWAWVLLGQVLLLVEVDLHPGNYSGLSAGGDHPWIALLLWLLVWRLQILGTVLLGTG